MPFSLDEATTPMVARLFVRAVEARGLPSDGVLAAAGLTRALVDDVRGEVTWAQCLRVIDAALALAPQGDLAVQAGACFELSDMDLAGLYLRSTASVRDALDFYREHRDALDPAREVHVYATDTAMVLSLPDHEPSAAHAALAECQLAIAITFSRLVIGPMTPIEARFRHRRPASDQRHAQLFGVVRFDSDVDALLLPVEVLERKLPHRDDTIRAVLAPHMARQIEIAHTVRADLRTRVLHGIRQELAAGRTSLDSLAKHLRTSPRSLRRELGQLGTSYSELLSQVRHELASQHALELPRRSGPDIAQALGYSDAHTFYRAFKRWTGTSLSEYRKQRAR